LRFWNHDALQDWETIEEVIWRALEENPSPPAPLPQGARGVRRRASPARDERSGRGRTTAAEQIENDNSPSPLTGEGWGEGDGEPLGAATPHPRPLSRKGRGEQHGLRPRGERSKYGKSGGSRTA
jgi:hypothetical protein